MRIIQTGDLTPESLYALSPEHQYFVYNGLDCCLTMEIFNAISEELSPETEQVYSFERSLQGPCLDMAMRGTLIDQRARHKAIADYSADIARVETNLNRILEEGIQYTSSWSSPAQLKHLFYDVMGLPTQTKRNAQNMYVASVDEKSLGKLENYFYAQPIVKHILCLRSLAKKVSTLKTRIDPDGRMRSSYNIAGTETGRFSSNLSDFGTGTNLQNIENRLRSIFVADPGYKLAYIDLEQAESRVVGAICWNLFGDGRYLDACESGDLHTSVCRMAWTDLAWSGDLKKDKEVAGAPFYRHHSFRDMAKRLGHGTNYNGQPITMAKNTNLETPVVRSFQEKYFEAFPAIKDWHEWVEEQLATRGCITSQTGRRRWFFGRRDDAATVREAIAYDPQGSVGDMLNRGMLNVWRLNCCQLLMQIHDAILIQYPEHLESSILPQVLRAIEVPLPLQGGRTLIIPSEAKVGWNWADGAEWNPDGLIKYTGHDARRRTPPVSILDRDLS